MYSEKFSYDIIHPTFYLFITKFPLYSNLERGLHELKIVTRGPGQTFSSRLSRVTNFAACFAYAARHHCAFDRVAPVTSRPIDLP